MNFDFDSAVNRRGTNSVKWNREHVKGICGNPDADAFWVADMDFQTEAHIKWAAENMSEMALFGYPTFDSLIDITATWLEKKHNMQVSKEDIVFTNGLLHGVALSIDLFTEKGDGILIPSPTYGPFRELTRLNERIMIDHELGYNDGTYYLDRRRFEKDLEKSKAILFCSPHNPSGLVFSRQDLEFILQLAKKKDIPVFSDEIHADLVHPGVIHTPMYEANKAIGAKVITFMAPSKTFNVAGEHAGFAIFSNKEMKDRFTLRQEQLYVTSPGYTIGTLTEAAYQYGLEYNQALCSYLGENCKAIREYLEKEIPEIRLANGEASFVTFLDCSRIYDKVEEKVRSNPDRYQGGKDSGPLSLFFGVDAGVCLNDGSWFGPQYRKFVRFNYGTSRSLVMEALDRMKKAVRAL